MDMRARNWSSIKGISLYDSWLRWLLHTIHDCCSTREMSKMGELWLDEIENIAERYAGGILTYQEAMYELMNRLGLDPHDADAELKRATE